METTKNHLIYDLMNMVRGGKLSDDELFSERQISFWIDTTRATLIRQDINKNRSINPDIVQSLGCVPVTIVDDSECPCKIVGCSTVMTEIDIPNTIETYQKNLITRVGPVQTSAKAYSFIPYQRAVWSGNNRFTKRITKAYLHNNRMYIVGPIDEIGFLEYINIQGVFEYPEAAADFTHCSGKVCYTNDEPYPIAAWMIETMKKMIIQDNFKIGISVPTDNTNNAKGDISQMTK